MAINNSAFAARNTCERAGPLARIKQSTRYFCTYFDQCYFSQGLAMYASLRRHCHNFTLWILCLDPEVYRRLRELRIPKVELITLEEFERGDELLAEAKKNRSLLEYYFTCTPSFPLFLLQNNPDIDLITYLDSDLFFFSSPDVLFDEIADHSVAIIPHRFSGSDRRAERYGTFNVGWVSFRRDNDGLACLQRWRAQCLAWCADQSEGDRFADQKYLDDWPSHFQNVVILQHKGANLAPWNLSNYDVSACGKDIYVDNEPLVFYHFHGLKRLGEYLYDTRLYDYKAKTTSPIIRGIYGPYLRKLTKLAATARTACLETGALTRKREHTRERPVAFLINIFQTIKRLLRRHYLVVIGGRVL
jgi:hypothetical protein